MTQAQAKRVKMGLAKTTRHFKALRSKNETWLQDSEAKIRYSGLSAD
jgi:hypothetical protein